jgi:hypothetical protein
MKTNRTALSQSGSSTTIVEGQRHRRTGARDTPGTASHRQASPRTGADSHAECRLREHPPGGPRARAFKLSIKTLRN